MKRFTKLLICVALAVVVNVSAAFALDPNPTRMLVTDTNLARALKSGAQPTVVTGQEFSPVTGRDEPLLRNVIRVSGIGTNPNDTAVVVDLGPEYMNLPAQPQPVQPVQPVQPQQTGATFDVKIEWSVQADIDLWVTEPGNANKIFYQNKKGAGELKGDNTHGGPDSSELYKVTNGPRGPYKIEIDYFAWRGASPAQPVPVRVAILRNGVEVQSTSVTLQPGQPAEFVFRNNGNGYEP